jgi:hypothetical protein
LGASPADFTEMVSHLHQVRQARDSVQMTNKDQYERAAEIGEANGTAVGPE